MVWFEVAWTTVTVLSMACVNCEAHHSPLQSVQNAAARLITGKRKFDHIASTMRDDLHWLRQRILFKMCSLVSKCLRRAAPSCLSDLRVPARSSLYVLLHVATWWSRALGFHVMYRAALLSAVPQLETLYQRPSRFLFIIVIIMFLQLSHNCTFLQGMALTHRSTFRDVRDSLL